MTTEEFKSLCQRQLDNLRPVAEVKIREDGLHRDGPVPEGDLEACVALILGLRRGDDGAEFRNIDNEMGDLDEYPHVMVMAPPRDHNEKWKTPQELADELINAAQDEVNRIFRVSELLLGAKGKTYTRTLVWVALSGSEAHGWDTTKITPNDPSPYGAVRVWLGYGLLAFWGRYKSCPGWMSLAIWPDAESYPLAFPGDEPLLVADRVDNILQAEMLITGLFYLEHGEHPTVPYDNQEEAVKAYWEMDKAVKKSAAAVMEDLKKARKAFEEA